jgi:hypothetical protein
LPANGTGLLKSRIVQGRLLNNFALADCLRSKSGAPKEGTVFQLWQKGSDPRIDTDFIALAWRAINGAISNFCVDERYIFDHGDELMNDVGDCLKLTHDLIPKASVNFHPLDFEVYVADYEFPQYMFGESLEFDGLRLMSAFTIICVDKAISALLEKNAKESAKLALYIGVSMIILKEYEESDHSVSSRNSAYARYAKDPKQKEKIFIFELWEKWQAQPKQYKSKASFARAMLEKCEHLTSQKKIEDWCREWEAEAKTVTLHAG